MHQSWAVLYTKNLWLDKRKIELSHPIPHISETQNMLPGLVLNHINSGFGFCFNFENQIDFAPVLINPRWNQWLTSFPGLILKKIKLD
jgi:hypothetical protein